MIYKYKIKPLLPYVAFTQALLNMRIDYKYAKQFNGSSNTFLILSNIPIPEDITLIDAIDFPVSQQLIQQKYPSHNYPAFPICFSIRLTSISFNQFSYSYIVSQLLNIHYPISTAKYFKNEYDTEYILLF